MMLPLSEALPLSSAAQHAKIITPSNSDGPASTGESAKHTNISFWGHGCLIRLH